MSPSLRFALMGCGDFGANLGHFVLEVADIVAVCDIEEARARRTVEALGLEVSVHTDYRVLLEAVELDAVSITAA